MRILHWTVIGILISLAASANLEKDKKSQQDSKKTAPTADAAKSEPSSGTSSTGRASKTLKLSRYGENRGKRTLHDFASTSYLYPQIASRRGGYTQDVYYSGHNNVAQFPPQYNFNYSPYPQYLEAPEPIIEIIIKDANETIGNIKTQSVVKKTKKKKEKVHVFYVNYKKDENNKLHLESPIASLNNDEADEEEEEEEEVIEYPVTPQPQVQTTTLRTIIHPDSEKYHSNSGIHVTFGSEDKSQRGHILEEHNAESVQRQVIAVPVPQLGSKSHYQVESRQDYHGQSRSPFTNNIYQTSSDAQFHQTQQLPNLHSTSYFRPPVQQSQQSVPHTQNIYKQTPFNSHASQGQFYHTPQAQPQQQQQQQHQQQHPQQQVRKPLAQLQQHIQQQLQQQSQYYVTHNQLWPQHQQQQLQQNPQYYNSAVQKTTQSHSNKQQPIVFPTAPTKIQELPVRQAPQPYQPIKFRPTTAPASVQPKPTHSSTKLENYNSKPLQFQRQPQFIQQPSFGVQSPTVPAPTIYKQPQQQQPQQQQQQQHQQQQHQQQQQQQQHHHQPHLSQQLHTTNFHSNTNYYTQNRGQQQQQQQHQNTQTQGKQVPHPPSGTASSGLGWLDIKPSRETELLKAIPKYEQHITETVQNNYQTDRYQTKNQVIHDIPAPNLAPQSQHTFYSNSNSSPKQTQQPQQQYVNFVTPASNIANAHHVESSTQAPQYVQSTDGQKIMVVTPMPPNVYQQYQSTHYPQADGNLYHSTQVVSSVQSQDQSKNYFYQHQQPRQGTASAQAQPQQQESPSSGGSSAQFSVSTYHSDVFKELGQRKAHESSQSESGKENNNRSAAHAFSSVGDVKTTTPASSDSKNLLQLPDEVPDDLRQQLLSSGILKNADISVLDYDKVGDIALENLPAEHLQHFYGAGGGAQISESKKVLTVVRPNGDKVAVGEKELQRVKETNHVAINSNKDTKVVRYEAHQSDSAESVNAPNSADRQYNRYLPLKINAANFPKPDVEELNGKSIQSVVVLAPVETPVSADGAILEDNTKEVKYLGGDLIKVLAKKPTKENFKRWIEKETRAAVEHQSVVLLVARPLRSTEQEIFMYDLSTGEVNKLNGELSSKFVSVAEENASTEDLDRGSTLDPNMLDTMIRQALR